MYASGEESPAKREPSVRICDMEDDSVSQGMHPNSFNSRAQTLKSDTVLGTARGQGIRASSRGSNRTVRSDSTSPQGGPLLPRKEASCPDMRADTSMGREASSTSQPSRHSRATFQQGSPTSCLSSRKASRSSGEKTVTLPEQATAQKWVFEPHPEDMGVPVRAQTGVLLEGDGLLGQGRRPSARWLSPQSSKPSFRDNSEDGSKEGQQETAEARSNLCFCKLRSTLARMLESPAFELSVSIIIVLNVGVMGFEVQYVGMDYGHNMNFPNTPTAAEQMPGAQAALDVLEFVFGCIFTLEMVLKLAGFGYRYFCTVWNWLDCAIVLGWLATLQGEDNLPIRPVFLRAFRTVRVLRLIRLTRSLHSLDSLYVMIMALQGSTSVIAWSAAVLGVMQAMVAIILSSLAEPFIADPDGPREDREIVFEYFGTFSRAFLTVFELTLANWPVPLRILSERVSEWFTPLLVCYVFLVGFGVVRVITGVFVTVTFYVAEHDDEIMIRRRVTAQTRHRQKMSKLFQAADWNGDGTLDLEEFCGIFEDMQVQTWLGAMEFGFSLFGSGPEPLFNLLEKDVSGEVSMKHLTDGVASLKGYAKSFTLAMVMHDVKLAVHRAQQVMRAMTSVEAEVKERLERIERKLKVTFGDPQLITVEQIATASAVACYSEEVARPPKTRMSRKFSFRMPALRSMRTVAAMDSQSAIEKKLFHGNLEGRMEEDEDGNYSVPVFLHNLAVSAVFELSFMGLIVTQALIVAVQTQYRGMELGYELEYRNMDTPAGEVWPGASDAFRVCDFFLGAAFSLELIINIAGLRRQFFRSCWSFLDIFATAMWILELISAAMPSLLRANTVRSIRLLRLARLLKLFKSRKEFRDVQLLWAALQGSFLSLFWSIALMFVLLVMTGLLIPSLLGTYFQDEDETTEDRKIVFGYYGTFTKSILTMFELSLANWMTPTRILTEKVSEFYLLYAIPHRLIVGFAMVTVLGAVFIQETFVIAKNDNVVQLNMRNRIIKHHIAKMQMFFEEADKDNSGVVDLQEFQDIVSKPGMTLWLSAMGLDVKTDVESLFRLIDNGDEQLTAAELLEGVARMKGNARNIDLTILAQEVSRLNIMLRTVRQQVEGLGAQVERVGSLEGAGHFVCDQGHELILMDDDLQAQDTTDSVPSEAYAEQAPRDSQLREEELVKQTSAKLAKEAQRLASEATQIQAEQEQPEEVKCVGLREAADPQDSRDAEEFEGDV